MNPNNFDALPTLKPTPKQAACSHGAYNGCHCDEHSGGICLGCGAHIIFGVYDAERVAR